MFEELEVLTESECHRIRSSVHDLKEYWIKRHPLVPFYSLAAATYMDGYNYPRYQGLVGQYNPVLLQNFDWLYSRILDVFKSYFRDQTIIMPQFAVPGFHIFLGDVAFARDNFASTHFDLQYQLLRWPLPDRLDLTRTISFTLPISLPQYGASLQIWNIDYMTTLGAIPADSGSTLQKTVCNYRLGNMLVHSGHQMHQMAPMKGMKAGDERTTFQGHALRYDGSWVIYW